MELAEGDICLTPLVEQGPDETTRQIVGGAWCELMYRSADVVLSDTNAIFEFLAHDSCIYLACIEKLEAGAGGNNPAYHTPLGILYIASAVLPNTLNIGVALHDEARGQGYAARAVLLAVGWAFAQLGCHRVQAQVVRYGDAPTDDALRLFAGMGFTCEGTQRRVLFCAPPTEGTGGVGDRATNGEWRDVSLFAVLDTDWALGAGGHAPRTMKTLWDDMFERHRRESEDIVALMDRVDERRRAREEQKKEAEEQRKREEASRKSTAQQTWGQPPTEQLWQQEEETAADTLWRQMQAEKAARDAAGGRPPPNPQAMPAQQPPPAAQTPSTRGSKSRGRGSRGRGRGKAGAGSRGGAPSASSSGGPSAPHTASEAQTQSWAAAARTLLPENQAAPTQAVSGAKAKRGGGRGRAKGAFIPAPRRATNAPDDTAEALSRISLADTSARSSSAASAASTHEN